MNQRILANMTLAGILPNEGLAALSDLAPADKFGYNILPLVHGAWKNAADTNGRCPDAELQVEWSRRSLADGCSLRLISETCESHVNVELLGTRLFWCPSGLPQNLLFGLASSRLGRELERRQAWFRTLRAACARSGEANETLLTARGTVPARFVMRCHELFGVDVLELIPAKHDDVGAWFQETVLAPSAAAMPYSTARQLFVSPPLDGTDDSPHNTIPVADRAIAALSDCLLLMFVRRGGHWEKLARWRTATDHWTGQTMLALGQGLVQANLRNELLTAGVVGWTVLGPTDVPPREGPIDSGGEIAFETVAERNSLPSWTYLTHCTRRRDGPWPKQVDDMYLDDLILDRPEADHSPLAALARIAQSERLTASCTSVSGSTPVVSFTEVPLEELQALRVFRAHRGHWDFEPYGICIRRDWLEQHNARRVCYAPREEWERMSGNERLYYQLDISRTRQGNKIDWTVEQEWRVVGDLLLDTLTPEDAFLFVPSAVEAGKVAGISRWPIRVLPRSGTNSDKGDRKHGTFD